MKNITIIEQRKLYNLYKETRLREVNNVIALLNTGSYSRPENSVIINKAKKDIMDFVSIFEDKIIEEAKDELFG